MNMNIAITKLDIVTNPSKFAIFINTPGIIAIKSIIKLDTIQTREYLTGILLFLSCIKTIIKSTNETIPKPNLKLIDITNDP